MIIKYFKYAVLQNDKGEIAVIDGRKAIDMFNNGYGISIYYSNNAKDIIEFLKKQTKNIKFKCNL